MVSNFSIKLPRDVPMETITTSFDIASLYTKIPHDLGVEAIDYWMKEHPESISAGSAVHSSLKESKLY